MGQIKNINTLWVSLNRICNHFNSDIEQIKSILKSQTPNNKKENVEFIQLLPELKILLNSAKEDDQKLVLIKNGESTEFAYKDLKYLIDEGIRMDQKNMRNDNLINIMSFNHFVALFDAALIDIVRVIFNYYPHFSLPLQKGSEIPMLSYFDVFNSTSVDALKQQYIEKRLFAIGMKSINDQIKFFRVFLKFDCHLDQKKNITLKYIDNTSIVSLIEIRETRNLHVHNNGIVNNNYHNKINEFLSEVNNKEKDQSKHIGINYHNGKYYNKGDFRYIEEDYIIDSGIKLFHLLTQIKDAVIEKLISQSEIDRLIEESREHFKNKQFQTPS